MRVLSSAALQALYASETNTVFIVLLTLAHPNLSNPIRVTSDAVATTSRGNTFSPFPFQVMIPDDDPDRIPQARLVIDNIDRSIVAALRSVGTTAPTLLIEVVTSVTPNTVEYSSGNLTMRDVEYDAITVSASLRFEEVLAEPFPGDMVTPATMPGVLLVD